MGLYSHVSILPLFRYAKSVGAQHFYTSAKQNRGIEDLFLDLTQRMMASADERRKKQGSGGGAAAAAGSGGNNVFGGRGNNITVVEDSQIPVRKRPCCGGGGGGEVATGIPVDNTLAASSQ